MLKRLGAAVLMSFVSESAIAQQVTQPKPPTSPTPPAASSPQVQNAPPAVIKPEPWWDSKWGEADTLGNVNNLTPEGAVKAAKLVTKGKVYGLAVATSPEAAKYGNRTYTVERTPGPGGNFTSNGTQRVTSFDEKVTTSMGIGTQIDGFGHLGVDHHYYNGITGQEIAGSRKLQPADIPPIVTRGVLLDMTKVFKKPVLQPTDGFGKKEIDEALKAQKLTIGKGDVVLFHTGWMSTMDTDRASYQRSEPGLTEDGAIYLAGKGVVAIGADSIALEQLPSPPGKSFIVHQTLLAKEGVHILESIKTAPLVKDSVQEFLFVLGVPRMEGTVQMVINPVAIR